MSNATATAAGIRVQLGHGEGNRKVVVHRNGRVNYYGSPSGTDRQHDYWHDGGMASDYATPEKGMSTITYHLVHLHAAPYPVLATPDSRWANVRAAYAHISTARARFQCTCGGLMTHAKFPLALRWSDDDGDTLHELPDAYDYGHYDGGIDGMSHDESYITAVERGMQAIAAQLHE